MPQQIITDRDTSHLDALLLDEQGRLKVVPAEVYAGIDWTDLRLWCHHHAIYGLPTTELVEYLKKFIGDRKAIEVGAGNGALGRALSIHSTDSFIQLQPNVRNLYRLQGQPIVQYGTDVERIEAKAAVTAHSPQVVIGSWVTQFSDGTRPGSMYGLDEENILNRTEAYVVFGSKASHGGNMKLINQKDHRVIQEPWMWSRAKAHDSALFIWGS